MEKNARGHIRGFTLLEMLLVLAISSSLILLLLNFTTQKTNQARRDKTVLQVQQIMNAALSYYVNNSVWPVTCGTSTWTNIASLPNTNSFAPGQGYIPTGFGNNPYAQPYKINCSTQSNSSGGNFYVATSTGTAGNNVAIGNATIVSGELPMAYVTTAGNLTAPPPAGAASGTVVVSAVAIPGQNLNNARSVNFAGVFYSGSCVPAPSCPPGMKAAIYVAPAGVSGVYDVPSCTTVAAPFDPVTDSCSANVYPISSFTAFATGDASGNPVSPGTSNNFTTGSGGGGPYDCNVTGSKQQQTCWQTYGSPPNSIMTGSAANALYWRVCLTVRTEKGQIVLTNGNIDYTAWGKMMGQIIAFTRCVPNNGTETPGGSQNVYQQSINFVP